jgi:hypothetical protein
MVFITEQEFVGATVRTVVRKHKKCYPVYDSFGRKNYVPVSAATVVARRISGIQCITRGGNQCSGSGKGIFVPVGGEVVAELGDYLEWHQGAACGLTRLQAGKTYRKVRGGNAYSSSQWVELL